MDGVSTLIDKVKGVDVMSNGNFNAQDYNFEEGKIHQIVSEEALVLMRSRKEIGQVETKVDKNVNKL